MTDATIVELENQHTVSEAPPFALFGLSGTALLAACGGGGGTSTTAAIAIHVAADAGVIEAFFNEPTRE